MKNRGATLRRLRELNKLSQRDAAHLVNCSVGWLSGIENDIPTCKITDEKLAELLSKYNYDSYKRDIQGWLSRVNSHRQEFTFEGATLKYLRKKSGKSLEEVADLVKMSVAQIAQIENGYREPTKQKRDLLVKTYGYSPESFNNFNSKDKRGHLIPSKFRLKILMRHLDEVKMAQLLEFAKQLTKGA